MARAEAAAPEESDQELLFLPLIVETDVRAIDLAAAQLYGSHAVMRMHTWLFAVLPQAAPVVVSFADDLAAATRAVIAARRARAPVSAQAVDLLERFRIHLDHHPPGVVDPRTFFPDPDAAGRVKTSDTYLIASLARICAELAWEGCPVRDAAKWRAQADALLLKLGPAPAAGGAVAIAPRAIAPAHQTLLQVWLESYLTAKILAESLLRKAGKLEMLPTVFPDLA